MAADDELARGLTQSTNNNTGGPITLTFPAIPGISWVLTDIDALFVEENGNNYAAQITTSQGAPIGSIAGNAGAAGTYGSDSYSWTGKVTGAVGTALTVTVTLSNATISFYTVLTATAYPI